MPFRPSLIVHGGAWNIPDSAVAACRNGCHRALERGWAVLARGGRAIDAVEASIMVLEDDPVFDAGTGAHLNRDGHIELDAIVMDGDTLGAGAVAAVHGVKNPILLARRVLERSPHMMLVGPGAEQFAREEGLPLADESALIVDRERELWRAFRATGCDPDFGSVAKGTVGAVARDVHGSLVAATSTGGTLGKHPGRVGDSPLIGCGCYADTTAGAVSTTGEGEAIMRIVMAKTAVEMMRAGMAPAAAAEACLRLLRERARGMGGLILLDASGAPGFAFTTPRMAFGYVGTDDQFVIPGDRTKAEL
jgi:beta-aspartyl-peptidase (threonine type)